MPVLIEGLQQVAVLDLPVAAGTAFWLGVRLDGEHLYTCGKHRERLQTLIRHWRADWRGGKHFLNAGGPYGGREKHANILRQEEAKRSSKECDAFKVLFNVFLNKFCLVSGRKEK